jgi:hypothetical protein
MMKEAAANLVRIGLRDFVEGLTNGMNENFANDDMARAGLDLVIGRGRGIRMSAMTARGIAPIKNHVVPNSREVSFVLFDCCECV